VYFSFLFLFSFFFSKKKKKRKRNFIELLGKFQRIYSNDHGKCKGTVIFFFFFFFLSVEASLICIIDSELKDYYGTSFFFSFLFVVWLHILCGTNHSPKLRNSNFTKKKKKEEWLLLGKQNEFFKKHIYLFIFVNFSTNPKFMWGGGRNHPNGTLGVAKTTPWLRVVVATPNAHRGWSCPPSVFC
jgi:hypothetical protein